MRHSDACECATDRLEYGRMQAKSRISKILNI